MEISVTLASQSVPRRSVASLHLLRAMVRYAALVVKREKEKGICVTCSRWDSCVCSWWGVAQRQRLRPIACQPRHLL